MSENHPNDDCTYTATWSDEDGVWVARVKEYPSLAAHGDTEEEALAEIRKVVQLVRDDLAEGL